MLKALAQQALVPLSQAFEGVLKPDLLTRQKVLARFCLEILYVMLVTPQQVLRHGRHDRA